VISRKKGRQERKEGRMDGDVKKGGREGRMDSDIKEGRKEGRQDRIG
jgi:hypothetical protein